jgi:hypothetical protein
MYLIGLEETEDFVQPDTSFQILSCSIHAFLIIGTVCILGVPKPKVFERGLSYTGEP